MKDKKNLILISISLFISSICFILCSIHDTFISTVGFIIFGLIILFSSFMLVITTFGSKEVNKDV